MVPVAARHSGSTSLARWRAGAGPSLAPVRDFMREAGHLSEATGRGIGRIARTFFFSVMGLFAAVRAEVRRSFIP